MRDRKRVQIQALRCSQWSSAGWCRDEHDRLILMRVPTQIDLKSTTEPNQPKSELEPVKAQPPATKDTESASPPPPPAPAPTHPPAFITLLPPELIHEIAWHLHPVDRVCLALTCKTLTSHILSAPLLSPTTWTRFSDHRYAGFLPESYSLILRLAHGWIPKDKLRYCSRCHKILPRDESYFRSRMSLKKTPRWNIKVRIEKEVWDGMSKRARYAQLLNDWCHTSVEDSSILCCDICRTKAIKETADGRADGNASRLLHYPPVQCPECLEKELTYVWRPPRQPWLRQKLGRILLAVYQPCEWVVCFICWCCFYGVRFAYRECKQCWRRWVAPGPDTTSVYP